LKKPALPILAGLKAVPLIRGIQNTKDPTKRDKRKGWQTTWLATWQKAEEKKAIAKRLLYSA
jgi:hypothetical protein